MSVNPALHDLEGTAYPEPHTAPLGPNRALIAVWRAETQGMDFEARYDALERMSRAARKGRRKS